MIALANSDSAHLAQWCRIVPLHEPPDADDADRRLAFAVRLELWRCGPQPRYWVTPAICEAAVEEIALAVEYGEIAPDNAWQRLGPVHRILSNDHSIIEPPESDKVAAALDRYRQQYRRAQRRLDADFPWADRADIARLSLDRVGPVVTASAAVALHLLREEVWADAAGVAAKRNTRGWAHSHCPSHGRNSVGRGP
jgi:hypothetical protein